MNKQAQEVIFSRKLNKPSHPKIVFNSVPVVCTDWQKDLGVYLDKALKFNLHIKEKMFKTMKGIGVIQKLNKSLPSHSLITIYNKSFVRPHLDYDDIIYDQPNNESFTQKSRTRVTSYKFKSTSYKLQFTSCEFESISYEFKSMSYEFQFMSYKFESMSYEFKSMS